MADNKVGSQAVATISLTVLHAPHIELHKNLHTGRKRVKLELVCHVQVGGMLMLSGLMFGNEREHNILHSCNQIIDLLICS